MASHRRSCVGASYNFTVFAQLATAQVNWLTRPKSNLAYEVERHLQRTAAVHESLVWIGQGAERQLVRLISVLYQGMWYHYLTNELAVALYWQRLPTRPTGPAAG